MLGLAATLNDISPGSFLFLTSYAFKRFGDFSVQIFLAMGQRSMTQCAAAHYGLTLERSAPASISRQAASACADSMARCNGVLPVFAFSVTRALCYGHESMLLTYAVGGIKTCFRRIFRRMQQYIDKSNRASSSGPMPGIAQSKICRRYNEYSTYKGVWLALSLALI